MRVSCRRMLSLLDDGGGVGCPVAFTSAKLTDKHTPWATIEREAYEVVWALKRFRAWVFIAIVRIFSVHKPSRI